MSRKTSRQLCKMCLLVVAVVVVVVVVIVVIAGIVLILAILVTTHSLRDDKMGEMGLGVTGHTPRRAGSRWIASPEDRQLDMYEKSKLLKGVVYIGVRGILGV